MSFIITKPAFIKLLEELEEGVTVKRPKIIEEISIALSHGDLRENAEYHCAKEEQRKIEARIKYLENFKKNAVVAEEVERMQDKVCFGSEVTIEDLDSDKRISFTILGEYEVQIYKNPGIISISSPFAVAVMGKNKGDVVEVSLPSGIKDYEILEVR